jgi:hypothetical protein
LGKSAQRDRPRRWQRGVLLSPAGKIVYVWFGVYDIEEGRI